MLTVENQMLCDLPWSSTISGNKDSYTFKCLKRGWDAYKPKIKPKALGTFEWWLLEIVKN